LKHFAKVIRIITLPPVIAVCFFVLVYFFKDNSFRSLTDFFLFIVFIAILPALIYPLSYAIPCIRKGGRKLQRSLALFFTPFCYLGLIIYLIITHGNASLWLIALTYFLSVLGLLITNLLKVKASGHACAIMGPFFAGFFFFGWWTLLFLPIPVLIFWSSLKTKGHTFKELLIGSIIPIVAVGIAYIAVTFF